MDGFVDDAETLFTYFANKHHLKIEKATQNNIELMMMLPKQSGLSFELTLGLQNYDEISIGFNEFWSYIFPFDKKQGFVEKLLSDLVSGNTRLAIYRQFGRVVCRDLEQMAEGKWKRVYREYCKIRIPLIRTDVSYVVNEACDP